MALKRVVGELFLHFLLGILNQQVIVMASVERHKFYKCEAVLIFSLYLLKLCVNFLIVFHLSLFLISYYSCIMQKDNRCFKIVSDD